MSDTPRPAVLRLRLLRDPALLVGADAIALSRKDAALLALLALDGSAPRDAIAAMLWPDATPIRARASLRQRRFRIARSAGAPLIDGEDMLRLASGVQHDADALDASLASDASALAGEWLDGLAYDDCPEFERWLQLARERWRVLRAQALARVAGRFEAERQLAPALALAARLAADEPLSDHAHRRLMRLHHLRGDLGAALDVYRGFAARLDAELGELPDDQTAELAARLREGGALPRGSAPVPSALRRPPRCVGREAALATLRQALEEGISAVVEGAPGIGKTRLLEDFAAARTAEGRRVLRVPSLSSDGERPYAVLVRMLASLWLAAGAPQPEGPGRLPAWARRELAALLPELGDAAANVDTLRLHRAVALALEQAALEVVVVDDVQQADAATLEMLPALTGTALPCWYLGTRAEECPPALSAWLHGSGAPRHLRLAPLDAAQIAELLADLALPGIAGAQWASELMRHTGGVPLFVLETLRGLHEQPGVTLAAQPLPDGAAQAVRARAARLPESARQLAHAAAVLRAPLTLEAGAQLLRGDAAQWGEAYAALESSQWLDAAGRLHDLVAAALRDAMPAAERRWLHGRIGAWLVRCKASPLDAAQHFEAAGRDDQAAPLFEAAGQEARRASRPLEDAALHRRAADVWLRLGRSDRAFGALRESLAPLRFAGGPAISIPVAQRLMTMARTPFERMAACSELAAVFVNDGDYRQAEPLARESYAIARSLGDPAEIVRISGVLVNAMAYNGQAGEAVTLLQGLRSLAESAGPETHWLYLFALVQALHRGSRYAECAAALGEALTLLQRHENWREIMTTAGNLALLLGSMGRADESQAALLQAYDAKERLGPVEGALVAGLDLKQGHTALALGRVGQAIGAYQRALRQYEATTASGHWLVTSSHGLATAHLLRGDAEAAMRSLVPITQALPGFTQSRRHLLLAEIAAAEGRDPDRELQLARDVLTGANDPAARLSVDAIAAQIGPGRDDPDLLRSLEDDLRALEQGAHATRLAWLRVDAMRRGGDAQRAAARTHELLAEALWPQWMLPCHWLGIAHAALAAAGDPRAAEVAARARAEHAATLRDLAPLRGPRAGWSAGEPAAVTAG